MNLKTILFPTDFSESSEAALAFASTLAAESGAKLCILHVAEDSSAYVSGYAGFAYLPEMAEQVAKENRTLLEQVKPTISGVEFEHRYETGSPAKEILELADREGVDLIVLGSHGRTGVSRLLMGSIAESVVRGANCPVLTVKQPLEAEDEGQDAEKGNPEKAKADTPAPRAEETKPIQGPKLSLH